MNSQEVFDKVFTHLISQGHQARGDKAGAGLTTCQYRGKNGSSCAVGCLIPDEVYTRDMEAMTVKELMCENDRIASMFSDVDIVLLQRLQTIHDSALNWGKRGIGPTDKLFVELGRAAELLGLNDTIMRSHPMYRNSLEA